ncbi:MAG: hypothetical protein E6K91_00845 [Thaumarchaeota archaeon]|nr:MAG: hypothetical protein E6K91_00845 [Nitrososphaerota archaeon]
MTAIENDRSEAEVDKRPHLSKISVEDANDIASKFFRQNFNFVNIKSTNLLKGIWLVQVVTSSLGTLATHVLSIDSQTGKILTTAQIAEKE